MTMSKDRVRFTLPQRYFQGASRRPNGFNRITMLGILRGAFSMTHAESVGLMDHYPNGFEIECRPSQFGRFIVLRHDANEGINGVRDLEPRIVQPSKPMDVYQCAALELEHLGLTPNGVREVAVCLNKLHNDLCRSTPAYPKSIDVSQRSA